MAKLRWERSKGVLCKADSSFTPGSILAKWADMGDYSKADYPSGPANFMELLDEAMKLPKNQPGEHIDFKGKVVLVTGGGGG
jgi:multifunctional beta-oxidation protein